MSSDKPAVENLDDISADMTQKSLFATIRDPEE